MLFAGAFFSVGPNDVRALGGSLIIAGAIIAAASIIGLSMNKNTSLKP